MPIEKAFKLSRYAAVKKIDSYWGFKSGWLACKAQQIYFPPNDYNIVEGYYTQAQIVQLLRLNSDNPQAVHFIADMLEE